MESIDKDQALQEKRFNQFKLFGNHTPSSGIRVNHQGSIHIPNTGRSPASSNQGSSAGYQDFS
jgi:hypothetical protein